MPCNCGSAHITAQLLQLLSESPTVATMLRPLVCASIAGKAPRTNKALHDIKLLVREKGVWKQHDPLKNSLTISIITWPATAVTTRCSSADDTNCIKWLRTPWSTENRHKPMHKGSNMRFPIRVCIANKGPPSKPSFQDLQGRLGHSSDRSFPWLSPQAVGHVTSCNWHQDNATTRLQKVPKEERNRTCANHHAVTLVKANS